MAIKRDSKKLRAQHVAFSDRVEQRVTAAGGLLKDEYTFEDYTPPRTSKRWLVETVGGTASVSVHGDGFDLFVLFLDIDKATECGVFNVHGRRFNGKWNHHFPGDTMEAVGPWLDDALNTLLCRDTP